MKISPFFMSLRMNIEIERKFLVKDDSFKGMSVAKHYLKQGYLCVDKHRTVRIRIADDKGFITIKGISNKVGMSRFEWEREISVPEANDLLNLALPTIIEKVRYIIPSGERFWEIDEFFGENEGLLLAEIELGSESETFEIPTFIGQEVTSDAKYYNSYLSQNPFKSW